MRHFLLISACALTCLTVGACATTKPAFEVKEVQVRPVLTNSSPVEVQEFDFVTALDEAQKLRRSSDYAASYNAYNVLFENIKSQDTTRETRADILLGLADSALSLTWLGETYEIRARSIYTSIYKSENSSEDYKRRAENGLLLLTLSGLHPDEAETYLRLALEDSPNDPRLWNALGKLHDGNENWLDALDAYVVALAVAKQKDISTAAVVNNMGMSLLMQGRKEEALTKFAQANKSNPDMPIYDNNLRLAQTLTGKSYDAVEGLSEVRTAQMYNDAGVIAQAQGQPIKAKSFYKIAIEKSPTYFEVAEKNLAGLLSDKVPDKPKNSPA